MSCTLTNPTTGQSRRVTVAAGGTARLTYHTATSILIYRLLFGALGSTTDLRLREVRFERAEILPDGYPDSLGSPDSAVSIATVQEFFEHRRFASPIHLPAGEELTLTLENVGASPITAFLSLDAVAAVDTGDPTRAVRRPLPPRMLAFSATIAANSTRALVSLPVQRDPVQIRSLIASAPADAVLSLVLNGNALIRDMTADQINRAFRHFDYRDLATISSRERVDLEVATTTGGRVELFGDWLIPTMA
ncbi:MAG: hypothetical protein AAF791_08525 [Bacteroidota bacterium]